MTERTRETEELGIRRRIAFLNASVGATPDVIGEFEIDVHWFAGDDVLVTVYYGETEEGAPIPIHAEYESTGSLETTLAEFVDRVLDLLAEGFELDSIVRDDFQSEYDNRVGLGMGDWMLGDRRVREGVRYFGPLSAPLPADFQHGFDFDARSNAYSDAYERNDPKNPDYLERIGL